MSFKDMLASDIQKVFLNDAEFAEKRTIRYDGEIYEDIPILLVELKQSEQPTQDIEGIYKVTARLHMNYQDIRVVPEKGKRIGIQDGYAVWQTYYATYIIISSSCSEGMITLELEANDE